MAIIISVDSDDEEAAVRGALAEAGLSFTIQRGRVYAGGGGSGAWSPGASSSGGGSGAHAGPGFGGTGPGGVGSSHSGGGAVGHGGPSIVASAQRINGLLGELAELDRPD